jgi:hypothetical protein
VRCYGEHVGEHIENLGEHIGNPLGTRRELSENTLGTRKDEKKILSPPLPPELK